MFSTTQFGRMLTDGVRHQAYVRALQRHVTPGSVVLDIGTGTGVYALIAAQLGARKIYGIDPNPLIQLARQHALDNGLADRVTFILGTSDELTLDEPADVIVTDLRDTLPFNGVIFNSLADAHARLLAPGGVVLPARDVVRIALVEHPKVHAEAAGPWGAPIEGLDFSAAAELEANTMRFGHCDLPDLLTAPLEFADLHYDEHAAQLQTTLFQLDTEVAATRDGTAHAIAIWFEATVVDDISYSTGPGSRPTVYRQAFLPLKTPLHLDAGQAVHLDVSCRFHSSWHWHWTVSAAGQNASPWRQSTMRAITVPDETVRLLHADVEITRRSELERDAAILAALASGSSVREVIAQNVVSGLEPAAASALVAGLVHRYVTPA